MKERFTSLLLAKAIQRETELMGVLRYFSALLILVAFLGSGHAIAKNWHVKPNGRFDGSGTINDPWDFRKACSDNKFATRPSPVQPGDTIFMHEGIYKGTNWMQLYGTRNNPIVVMPYKNARVRIDINENPYTDQPGLRVSGDYIYVIGLEFYCSNTGSRVSSQPGSRITDIVSKNTVELQATNSKLIDLIIRNATGGGILTGNGAHNSEIYGCIIYNTGWDGPDRGHGHAMYLRNDNSNAKKIIENNITFNMFGRGISGYGDIEGFDVKYNISFGNGSSSQHGEDNNIFFGGSGRSKIIDHLTVADNATYHSGSGGNVRLGYLGTNKSATVRNNHFVGGWQLRTGEFDELRLENNETNLTNTVKIYPNKYTKGKAHIAVYNKDKKNTVSVDLSGFVSRGSTYTIKDAQNLYGKTLSEGTYNGGTVDIPLNNTTIDQHPNKTNVIVKHTPIEFNAFVITSDSDGKEGTVTYNPPTVNNIADQPAIDINSARQEVSLTGIGSGSDLGNQISVSAKSNNNNLITNLSVRYNHPDKTAVLSYVPGKDVHGAGSITVTVNNGNPQRNTIERSFNITVNKPVQEDRPAAPVEEKEEDNEEEEQQEESKPVSSEPATIQGLYLVNSTTNEVILELTNNMTIKEDDLPVGLDKLNIQAKVNDDGLAGSVRWAFNDRTTTYRIDNSQPFSIGGNTGDDFLDWHLEAGTHRIDARAHTEADARGNQGHTRTIHITVVTKTEVVEEAPEEKEEAPVEEKEKEEEEENETPAEEEEKVPVAQGPATIQGLYLVNALTNEVIFELTNNMTIKEEDLQVGMDKLNIQARVNDDGLAGSIRWAFNDRTTTYRIDNSQPFSIGGNTGDDFHDWHLEVGTHRIDARAHTEADAQGDQGHTITIHITVVAKPEVIEEEPEEVIEVPIPIEEIEEVEPVEEELEPVEEEVAPAAIASIEEFHLINAITNRRIRSLADGDTIFSTLIPVRLNQLNIEATTTEGVISTVQFGYNDNEQYSEAETAPYAIGGARGNNYNLWRELRDHGWHEISATVSYTSDDEVLSSETVTISIYVADESMRAPIVSSFQKSTFALKALNFSDEEFSLAFEDESGNDLQRIKVMHLPSKGQLFFKDFEVFEGEEIDVNDIDQLSYLPGNEFELDAFSYRGSNGASWSENEADVSIIKDTPTFELVEFYPNPVTDHVKVRFESFETEKVKVQVHNLNGQLMDTFESDANDGFNEIEIVTSHLINGMYIVSMHNRYHNFHFRIVK